MVLGIQFQAFTVTSIRPEILQWRHWQRQLRHSRLYAFSGVFYLRVQILSVRNRTWPGPTMLTCRTSNFGQGRADTSKTSAQRLITQKFYQSSLSPMCWGPSTVPTDFSQLSTALKQLLRHSGLYAMSGHIESGGPNSHFRDCLNEKRGLQRAPPLRGFKNSPVSRLFI